MAVSTDVESPPWPPLSPTGWSWPAFALGAFWYLRQGLTDKGRVLIVPQGVVSLLAILNALVIFQQGPFETAVLRAVAAALVLWSLVGSFCAASYRGDAYRDWCAAHGQAPVVPTQWQWGAFLLTGGWYVAHGIRVKGLWLWLAFFTAVGSIVGIPLAFALMCYCGANFRAERYLEKPPADIGPTPQERWLHQDLLKALTAVAQTPQPSLRASLLETAVRGLRRQGYTVRLPDDQDESAAALTLERGARFVAVRVVPAAPVPAAEVERLVAVLEDDRYRVGVLMVTGPLSAEARAAATRAHVRVLHVEGTES